MFECPTCGADLNEDGPTPGCYDTDGCADYSDQEDDYEYDEEYTEEDEQKDLLDELDFGS